MTETKTVTLDRTYPVEPQKIWRAWTDPDLLGRWHGCAPNQLWTVHEWQVRVGGLLRVSMDMMGEPFEVEGEFLEVQENERLRYSFGEGITITITIDGVAEGTRVTVEHAGLPDGEMHGIVTEGWTSSLSQLAAAL